MAVRHLGGKKKTIEPQAEVDSRFHLRGPRTFLSSLGGLDTHKPTQSHSINSRDPATTASHIPRSPLSQSQGQPAAQDPRPHPGTRTAACGAPRTPRGLPGRRPLLHPGSRKPGRRRGDESGRPAPARPRAASPGSAAGIGAPAASPSSAGGILPSSPSRIPFLANGRPLPQRPAAHLPARRPRASP